MLLLLLATLVVIAPIGAKGSSPHGMAKITGGQFKPFFDKDKDGKSINIDVQDFYIDKSPVTNGQFLKFVTRKPEWNRSRVKNIFADSTYLKHWEGDLKLEPQTVDQPVRFVSWFAALAYCESEGKTLPTVTQWEYVASADEKSPVATNKKMFNQKILNWYSRPNTESFPAVRSSTKNFWGLYDLHGLIWEWNLDYNTALVTGESREDSALDRNKFCGSGSFGAKDKSNYAAFMRFGFRSSLRGNYTVANLGFRCAKNIEVNR